MKRQIFTAGLAAMLTLISILQAGAFTIHSNVTGGIWDNTDTWQEAVIPGANDTAVIISGSSVSVGHITGYTIYNSWVARIIIESGATLFAPSYGGGLGTFTLTVYENLENYGTITGGEEHLDIELAGNLTNFGYYGPHQTNFTGTGAQMITLGDGDFLGGVMICTGTGPLVASSDFTYTGSYSVGTSNIIGEFNLNGRTLDMGTHAIKSINTLIYGGTIAGNFEILGTFSVSKYTTDTLIFQGNITVTDTLQANVYGGGYGIYKLKVIGNITNNGWVKDNVDTDNADDLDILITGNITNHGRWTNNFVSFIGPETQYIEQSEGMFFESNFTDLNASSPVLMNSHITITKDIDLNQSTLEGQGYSLFLTSWLKDGFIHDITLHSGYLQNIQSSGNLFITGNVTADNGNIFNNLVTVTDTLQSNEYGGGSTTFDLIIGGDITNNGVIQNINSGDKLKLLVQGNIINNGEWNHSFTVLTGSGNHNLSQTVSHSFGGDFSDTDPSGMTVALTDLTFTGNYNLGTGWLEMGGHVLTMSGWLTNGTIASTILRGGFLENLTSEGELTIEGKVTCSNGNHFWDNITISDTLQSIDYGGGSTWFDLYIDGNITNNGVMMNINSGDMLRTYISGNIANHGEWLHSATVLNGTMEQLMAQNEEMNFGGNFSDSDAGSAIAANSNLTFTGNFDLNGSTFEMNNYLLTVEGTLSDGNIDNAHLAGGVLSYITSLGNLNIEGTVTCDDGNSFSGVTTVTGILQSNEYGGGSGTFELQVNGDLINNGIVRNINSGDRLHIYITGDLKNNGSWVNNLTYLEGTEDQRIYLIGDTPIEGEVKFDAVLNTSPFQWYHEGTVLNSSDFTGETSQVLVWTVPVSPTWYGVFHCETGGGISRQIIVQQAVVPPSTLELSYECTDVFLVWEMPAGSNPDNWNIYCNGDFIATVDVPTFTHAMVMPDQNYDYWVTAVYAGEESIPGPVENIFVPIPENLEPLDFFVENIGGWTAYCYWTSPSGCAIPEGYNIYRDGVLVDYIPAPDTVFNEQPGYGMFEYSVTAVYYFGESDPSNSMWVIITSIEDRAKDDHIRIFPNPANSELFVQSSMQIRQMKLLDGDGREVIQLDKTGQSFEIPVSTMERGIYIMKITMSNGKTVNQKIILK